MSDDASVQLALFACHCRSAAAAAAAGAAAADRLPGSCVLLLAACRDFVTGFRKRKQQRRKVANQQLEKKAKQQRVESRAEVRTNIRDVRRAAQGDISSGLQSCVCYDLCSSGCSSTHAAIGLLNQLTVSCLSASAFLPFCLSVSAYL